MRLLCCFLFALIFAGCKKDANEVYLVKETSYFHSSNDINGCRFIKDAQEKGYKIERINLTIALYRNYKMCHYCFSIEQRKDYERRLSEKRARELRLMEEQNRMDSLINSVSDEAREAIIEDYLESQGYDEREYYDERDYSDYIDSRIP